MEKVQKCEVQEQTHITTLPTPQMENTECDHVKKKSRILKYMKINI
jgi:hypothetical protein